MSRMSNWLKAGLIGAAVVVVLHLLGIVPCVACLTWPLVLVTYGCAGALAAYWMPPSRQAGPAAGQGALAGAVAGAVSGGAALLLAAGIATVFVPLGILSDAMGETGIDPAAIWETVGGLVASFTCGAGIYIVNVAIATGLGALGGLIFAVIRPE